MRGIKTRFRERDLFLLAALALALGGCFGLNHIQVFTVSMVNDTPRPVVARDCEDFCSSSPLVFDLAPGQSVPLHRVANEHKYFSVTTPSGTHIGCVDLYFKTPEPGASVPISAAGPCPGPAVPWKTIALIAIVLLPVVYLIVMRSPFRRR